MNFRKHLENQLWQVEEKSLVKTQNLSNVKRVSKSGVNKSEGYREYGFHSSTENS